MLPKIWKWNPRKCKIARLIAHGMRIQDAANEGGMSPRTVEGWYYEVPEFRSRIDKMTLEHDLISRAGMTRMLLNVIEKKFDGVEEDKDTVLAYLKFLKELKDDDTESVTELKVEFK